MGAACPLSWPLRVEETGQTTRQGVTLCLDHWATPCLVPQGEQRLGHIYSVMCFSRVAVCREVVKEQETRREENTPRCVGLG